MKTMIAMSGGVDSAVSAYIVSQGGDSVGATMKLCSGLLDGDYAARADEDVADAKKICDALSIQHFVFDMSDTFRDIIVQDFIDTYKNGGTPNPCVLCNKKIKFGAFLDAATELGADKIATGHYARIEKIGDRFILKRAADRSKDQSYVLYSLSQQQLARAVFPLGELSKAEVREIADSLGFINARKRDSQDICFIPDGDYFSFIKRITGEDFPRGSFIDIDGNVLGEHEGIIKYTVGQRKGLGLALGEPMYVKQKNVAENTVTLVKNDQLFSRELSTSSINLIACDSIPSPIRVRAKIRYNQTEQPATVVQTDADTLSVVFDEPQRAISKGQSLVLYDGDTVVGGGIIN